MTHEQAIKAIEEHGLPRPPPEHTIEELQYSMGNDDWHFKSQKGWYWLDARKRLWLPSHYGPTAL